MKRFAVAFVASAERDLDEIADWYVERHPAGQDRFFRDFATACDLLAAFPNAGRARDDLATGLRSHPVHPYLIFYVIEERSRRVLIRRVLHGGRDIDERTVR